MNILSILGLSIVASVLYLTVKQYRPEFAVAVGAVAGIIIMAAVLSAALPIVNKLGQMGEGMGEVGQYIAVPIKSLGICYVGQFAGDICRDAGQSSLAGKVELATRVAVVAVCLPLIGELLGLAEELIAV